MNSDHGVDGIAGLGGGGQKWWVEIAYGNIVTSKCYVCQCIVTSKCYVGVLLILDSWLSGVVSKEGIYISLSSPLAFFQPNPSTLHGGTMPHNDGFFIFYNQLLPRSRGVQPLDITDVSATIS